MGKAGYDLPRKTKFYGDPNPAQPTMGSPKSTAFWGKDYGFAQLRTKRTRGPQKPKAYWGKKQGEANKTGKMAENRRFFDKRIVYKFAVPDGEPAVP